MKSALLFCAACAVLSGAEPKVLIQQLAGYEFGSDPSVVRELENLAFHAFGSQAAPVLEKLLLEGLPSARTAAAKDALLRDLAIVGGETAIPQLAGMLNQPDTVEMARYAIERIGGPQATAALRAALPRASAAARPGIVISLGRLRDEGAVIAIQPLLGSKDVPTASAAANALANIGSASARDALLAAPPSPPVSAALLKIAQRSDAAAATPIYRRMLSAGLAEADRIASLHGLARVDPKQAAAPLHDALKNGSPRLQGIAVRELALTEGVALAKQMGNVPELAGVQIIAALADSGRPEVRAVLLEGVASESQAVRVTSLDGLAKLGTDADIPMLAGRAAASTGDEQAAARAALSGIPGAAADSAILRALPSAEPKTKVELIRAIGARGMTSASDALLSAAADKNRAVRVESVRALRETATAQQVPALLDLLMKTSSDTERKDFERTVAAAIGRSPGAPVTGVIAAYRNTTDPDVRTSLLNVMSAAGNSEALPAVRQAMQDSRPDIQRAALNALSAWPTPAPMDDLLALARSAGDPALRILALRGYIKLVQLPSNRTPAETAGLLRTAMSVATRPEEKRTVLAAAQKVVCPDSLELARSALSDPQVAAEAQLAVTTLQRLLNYVQK